MNLIEKLLAYKTKFQDRSAEIETVDVNEQKLPVFPQWYQSARLGQPRVNFNLPEIRQFSKSSWVQMVENSQKKTVQKSKWKIVLKDEDSDDDIANYQEDVDKITKFLELINVNKEDINDLISSAVTDLAEIDAGVWAKIYSEDSYTKGTVTHHGADGTVLQKSNELILKPFGQRRLLQMFDSDGGMFYKNVDIYKRMHGYYQYSFRHSKSSPRWFDNDEIVYFLMNKRPDSVYGFSPVQAVQQVIEVLIQSTRYNKEFFKNNAIPDALLNVKNASPESLKKIKTEWQKQFKSKAHKFGVIKADAVELVQFSKNLRDMEWLEGQKWYFHLVFAIFGVSPAEAGFYEDSNRSTQEGQERVTAKNAIRPILDLFERKINVEIIPEILQKSDIKVKFKFFLEDKQAEAELFKQQETEIRQGTLTINEFRREKGRDTVEWGDTPGIGSDELFGQSPFDNQGFSPNDNNNKPNDKKDSKPKSKEEEKQDKYKKRFEKFISLK